MATTQYKNAKTMNAPGKEEGMDGLNTVERTAIGRTWM